VDWGPELCRTVTLIGGQRSKENRREREFRKRGGFIPEDQLQGEKKRIKEGVTVKEW